MGLKRGISFFSLCHFIPHFIFVSTSVDIVSSLLEYIMFLQGWVGGTTVSGTMVAAHMAGIQVFVTGGIGGVHRGAEKSKLK